MEGLFGMEECREDAVEVERESSDSAGDGWEDSRAVDGVSSTEGVAGAAAMAGGGSAGGAKGVFGELSIASQLKKKKRSTTKKCVKEDVDN